MKQGVLLGFLAAMPSLLGVGAAEDSARDGRADFDYRHGFVAAGQFEGRCGLAGVRFPPGEAGTLGLAASRIRLVVLETWVNETALLPDAYYSRVPLDQTIEQSRTERELVPGLLTVAWNASAHVLLTDNALDRIGSLEADLEGTRWESGAPDHRFGTPAQYYERIDDQYVSWTQALDGPARTLRTDQSEVAVRGHGFLKLDGALLEASGDVIQLPPQRQVVENETASPLVQRSKILETHAVVELDGLEALLPAAGADLVCDRLDWSGRGVATFRTADGQAVLGTHVVPFHRQELTLEGRFEAQEEAAVDPDQGGAVLVAHHQEGSYRSLGVDFVPVARAAASEWADPARWGVVAALTAAVAAVASQLSRFVALFYSRVGHDRALEHPVRAAIVAAARDRPGLILRDLVESTHRPYAVVRHHTRVLAILGLVRTVRDGKALHLFPHQASLVEARRSIVWNRDAAVRFLVGRAGTPGRPLRDLMVDIQDHLGYSRMGAWKVVRRAERVGFVRCVATESGVVVCAVT